MSALHPPSHPFMSRPESDASLSRRNFLALSGAGAAALVSGMLPSGALRSSAHAAGIPAAPLRVPGKRPIGLELYSVRGELARDLPGTLRAVAGMGYEAVEFYAPYLRWTLPYAKDVRTLLDDLGLRCLSTHNAFAALTPGETMTRAIELNQILGARQIVLASPPSGTNGLEDWKQVCGQLTAAAQTLASHGLSAGFHNHRVEWSPLADGRRIMDVVAAETPPEFVLQLDVGTCLEAGADPLAWIAAHPGRIRSVHLKDWTPGKESDEKSYRVLFGEGAAPWARIVAALESTGGVEFYLMEQEGSRYSELETARRCLDSWHAMRRAG